MSRTRNLINSVKNVHVGEFLVKSAIGIFLVSFLAQVLGGYILNRIEEQRKKNTNV